MTPNPVVTALLKQIQRLIKQITIGIGQCSIEFGHSSHQITHESIIFNCWRQYAFQCWIFDLNLVVLLASEIERKNNFQSKKEILILTVTNTSMSFSHRFKI